VPAKNVGRKRTIDESLLPPEEAKKLESRRAYNRQCAAKARKRSKDLVAHLQGQVEELTKEKAELKRANEVMRAQLELLEQQNRTLMINQLAGQAFNPTLVGGAQGLGAGGGAFPAGAGGLGGQGMGGGQGAMSLLDRLAVERAAAQNRLQALQAQGLGGASLGFPSLGGGSSESQQESSSSPSGGKGNNFLG
jgi:hypothetical protein